MSISPGRIASRIAPHAYSRYLDFSAQRQRTRIERLLADTTAPLILDEAQFAELVGRRFPRAASYEYDRFSAVARAAGRVQRLKALLPELLSPSQVIEVSCGDGFVGAVMALGGHDATLADIRDWRSDGARHLPFVKWDVGAEPTFTQQRFDLVMAYNATEHWELPATALTNLLSLCKPGARLVLDFGPLFNSPWGLHAWSIGFPYPQFLFDRKFIEAQIGQMGVNDLGEAGHALQPTNGWSIDAFHNLWRGCDAEILFSAEDRDFRYLDFIEEFAACFRGRNLRFDDLTINSIEIVLGKPAASTV